MVFRSGQRQAINVCRTGVFLALVMLVWQSCRADEYRFKDDECKSSMTLCLYVAPAAKSSDGGRSSAAPTSLERAQSLIIEYRKSHPDARVIVVLMGGRYELQSPLVISPESAGVQGGSLEYVNYPGQHPVLSGGRRVTGWKPYRDGIFQAKAEGRFRQLFVNGEWAQRARTPNVGVYYRIKRWYRDGMVSPDHAENKRLVLDAKEVRSIDPGVEMHVQRVFNGHIYRVASANSSAGELYVKLADPESDVAYARTYPRKLDGQAYHLEGALGFVDQKGEWFLDRDGILYLAWSSLDDVQKSEVRAPHLESLIVIAGRKEKPVTHVRISGIRFTETTWTEPDEVGFVPKQGSFFNMVRKQTVIPGAIHIRYARDIIVSNNHFDNLGGAGLVAVDGLANSRIDSNEFSDIAACGIVLGAIPVPNATAERRIDDVSITGNKVRRMGQDYPGSVGIIATYVSNVLIKDNVLEQLPYSAISVGWGWTKNLTGMQNNSVVSNTIRSVMTILSDGGAIYFLSNQPNSDVTANTITGIHTAPWNVFRFMSAIYLDAGASGIAVRKNKVDDIGVLDDRNRELFNARGNPPIRQ